VELVEGQNLVVSGSILHDKESDKSVCIVNTQIEDSQDSVSTVSFCEKEIKGQFHTNLKRHLKNCHYEQYK